MSIKVLQTSSDLIAVISLPGWFPGAWHVDFIRSEHDPTFFSRLYIQMADCFSRLQTSGPQNDQLPHGASETTHGKNISLLSLPLFTLTEGFRDGETMHSRNPARDADAGGDTLSERG